MSFVFGPQWFYGIDATFELIALFVTLIIALYSLRIFFIAWDKKYMYLTMAFGSISVSYLIRTVVDWMAYSHFMGRIPNVTSAVSKVLTITELQNLGFLAYVFFAFGGFMILVAIFLKIRNIQTLSLLFIMVVLLTWFSGSGFTAFHITLSIMLFYIVIHLLQNYLRTKKINSFLVLYGMISLLVAQLIFFLRIIDPIYYVIAHCIQLIGFLTLLLNMIILLKK